MGKYILAGCDVHKKTLVVKASVDREASEGRTFANTPSGRRSLIAWRREKARAAGADEMHLAYEASGLGFGLYDELTDAGVRASVLAPTRIARSQKQRRQKTDRKDAERLLEILRGHVLAGNALPAVWVPDAQTRDDRELVRARLDVGAKVARVKTQIRMLLARQKVEKPAALRDGWTRAYRQWLERLAGPTEGLSPGARAALGTLGRQLDGLKAERRELDKALADLAAQPRYAEVVEALRTQRGVGVLTALVFLTELGDLSRFRNRRQVGAYLGLVCCCDESGEAADRKGRITRQGPGRVRKLLCEAVHVWIRTQPAERSVYQRIVTKNPNKKKKAVVASMRRLAIRLWRLGAEAQRRGGVFAAAPAAPAPG